MIGIIGKGRLGEEVARLFEDSKTPYFGTKTSSSDTAIIFNINSPFPLPEKIKQAHSLIINIPPSRIESLEIFKKFIQLVEDKYIIFVSSTSVYEGLVGYQDEDSKCLPTSARGRNILFLESIIKDLKSYCIIRPAGLYDHENHPGKILSGKKDIQGGNDYINLVSRAEVAKIIFDALRNKKYKMINAVNNSHPLKKDYYTEYCKKMNLILPEFLDSHLNSKIIKTKYEEFEINSELP